MERIEIFIEIRLPNNDKEVEVCKHAIVSQLKINDVIKQVMLIPKSNGEAEISFCFEGAVNLNRIIAEIKSANAVIIKQYIHLPSSFSGVADVYDASIAAEPISIKLKTLPCIKDASVSNEGIVRIECYTMQLDELLRIVQEQLLIHKRTFSKE